MGNVTPVDEEYMFEEEGPMVSQTDTQGRIIYANKKFRQVSGYELDELVGVGHNIVRHPDMPRAVFSKMWDTIKSSQVFNGTIKNMRKDGRYYWVELEILPIKDEDGEILNFMAVARGASRKDIEENKELYERMLETQMREEDKI